MPGRFRADPSKNYMAISINWGSFGGCPYNRRPTSWGLESILGLLIFGNSHISIQDPNKRATRLHVRSLTMAHIDMGHWDDFLQEPLLLRGIVTDAGNRLGT